MESTNDKYETYNFITNHMYLCNIEGCIVDANSKWAIGPCRNLLKLLLSKAENRELCCKMYNDEMLCLEAIASHIALVLLNQLKKYSDVECPECVHTMLQRIIERNGECIDACALTYELQKVCDAPRT